MGAPSPASAGLVPFREQGEYFARKVNIKTLSWTDLVHGQHAPSFVVSGAARDDLLSDLRAAVDKVIHQGQTLEGFRKEFDTVVGKYGWAYNGGRNWRTRVIYETNLRSSYQVGRYKQLMEISHQRPYWIYRHNDAAVVHPRPIHQSWSGTTLQWDSPWWSTHYPPNGWGCKCYIDSASERDLQRMGKSGPDTPPPLDMQEVTIGTRGPNPKVVKVPKGIDPGWGYNPGEAAWGRGVARQRVAEQSAGKWVDLPGKMPADYGLPKRLPAEPPSVPPGPAAESVADVVPLFEDAIGGEQVIVQDPLGESILVDRAVPEHVVEKAARLDGRERMFPLMREVVEKPQEVWLRFAKEEATGRVAVRRSYVRVFDLGKQRSVGVIVQSVGNVWTALTVFRGDPAATSQRQGYLLYSSASASAEAGLRRESP